MLGTKQPLLYVFLDASRMQVGESESTIRTWEFPIESIQDSRIINGSLFISSLEKFFSDARLTPGRVTLVLSETIIFSQKISPKNDTEKHEAARVFYDMVPSENVLKKEYKEGSEILLVAADSDFVKGIASGLLHLGCTIAITIPALILGAMGEKRWLDSELVTYLAGHNEELSKWNLNVAIEQLGEAGEKPSSVIQKKSPPYLLIGIFLFLILVLILLLVFKQ